MKTLFIIGDADSDIVVGCRISESKTVNAGERAWATLTTRDPGIFIADLDEHFRDRLISPGNYSRSPQVVIGHLKRICMGEAANGIEYTLEMFDQYDPGFTTSLVKRAKPMSHLL